MKLRRVIGSPLPHSAHALRIDENVLDRNIEQYLLEELWNVEDAIALLCDVLVLLMDGQRPFMIATNGFAHLRHAFL